MAVPAPEHGKGAARFFRLADHVFCLVVVLVTSAPAFALMFLLVLPALPLFALWVCAALGTSDGGMRPAERSEPRAADDSTSTHAPHGPPPMPRFA